MASSSKKVIIAAFLGNTLIAITKFIAAFMTGSSAMLSEGIHSIVDTGNQLLLLLGLKKSRVPADEKFPYGHGKEVYFWSFVVALLIFAVGAGVSIYEGIHSIMDPHPIENILTNYIVLGLAVLFEGGAWMFALKEFSSIKGTRGYIEAIKTEKDPTNFVVLFEDSAALLGLSVAFAGITISHLTGIEIYDGVASIIIGIILGTTAIWLAYETKGLLIGESANPHIVEGIEQIAGSYETIILVNETLTMHMGPEYILVNISVDFHDDLDAGKVEQTISELTLRIKEQYPKVKRVFIEAEKAMS